MKRMLLIIVPLLMMACDSDSSDDEPANSVTPSPAAVISLTLTGQSITDNAEVDAAVTTMLTLTYSTGVLVPGNANITLNGARLMARANGQTVEIPLSLSDDTNYTLTLAEGAVVAAADASVKAPALTLHFKTAAKQQPQPSPGGSISSVPVAATTDAALKLYSYLLQQYGKKTISSVMANVNWNNDCAEKVCRLTGKYPAMNCYDFIHICFSPANWIDYTTIKPVQQWTDAGGLVQLMWHFNVPKREGSTDYTCTPSETTFRAANALKEGTWEHKWFYGQMDKVVATMLKLQDAGIAATWRPFHEAAGNATARQQADWTKSWFWWGYDGAEVCKRLWTTMFDYFQQKGIHNLIWVWTTQNYNGNSSQYRQDTDWYPGDQYVDIVARDLYGYNGARNQQEFTEIQSRYPTKMVALGECGRDGYTGNEAARPSDFWQAGACWSHFMVWYQGGEGSTDTMCSDSWWKAAMSSPDVITRDQLPNLK